MAQQQTTYQGIERPYDNLLQRGTTDLNNVSKVGANTPALSSSGGSSSSSSTGGGFSDGSTGNSGGGTSPSSVNGSVETMPVKSDGAIDDIWINNFIRSTNWKPKSVGFSIEGQSGYAEFTNVYISGEIDALSGVIGGFTIGATDLSATDGTNTTILSSGPIAFQAGPTGLPTVEITQDGFLTAMRANITGSITAQSGSIGGFEITDTHLMAGYGPTKIQLDTTQGIFLGDNSFALAPFSVSLAGELRSVLGVIGGWTITEGSLSATGITLDSQLQRIMVGSSSPIIIDGINKKIESSNYVSGIFGAGFHLDANLFEVGNIAARGMIRTAVFQKDVVSAVGGNLAVLDGDVLDTDMTALDSCTLTTKGVSTFATGDILRIKDGLDDEWFTITSSVAHPTYIVTRDRAGIYPSNNNPTWKKGASVINYGGNGDGGVYMTASESNAPYLSIFDHAGSPWSSINTRLRLGNLNGFLGYTENVYGIAIGETDKYLKYDPIYGLSMQGNITIGASNSIKGGQTDYNTGSGFFLGYSAGYKFSIGNQTTNYMTWDGTYLKLKGSFDVGDGGVINNASYTVANLPIAPTSVGYNNPSGIE